MQKGSQISGAAVSEEVFESSDHVLGRSQYGNFKGLQQFFTPEAAADLAAYVTSSGYSVQVPVFDPTAGDGSFLRPVDPAFAFGVEIDQDQIDAAEGSYNAVQGDIQKVWPLINRVAPEFSAVWANPPFGLKDWSDPTVNDGKPVGSVVLTFVYATRILASDGQLVFICGRDQFHREIANLPEARGIYYVVECDDLGKNHGFEHPAAIAFGVHPDLRSDAYNERERRYEPTEGFEVKSVPLGMLDMVGPKIVEARLAAIGRYNSVARRAFGGARNTKDAWDAIAKEYARRQKAADGKKPKREFDVELFDGGKRLNVLPSPFASLALGKKGMLASIKGLHGKAINYFATYERDWKTLMEARELGILGVDPKVVEVVEELLHVSRRATTPRYPIKETQRLGWLLDLNLIKCKKADPERGFVVGESYEITSRSVDQTVTVQRPVTVKRGKNAGEIELRDFEQQRKALRVTIDRRHNFYDSLDHQEDIKYLIEHFEMPEPGDVGTRYPVEVEANRKLLQQIEDDTIHPCSVKYAEAHPEKPPVRLRTFQREDLARGLVDNSIVLAWEQGLGKTLAGLAYIQACFRKGAQEAALFIVPQDLIPQWQAEAERFLGKKLTLIKSHAQAKDVAKKLRMGGKGLYITYYEALAVTGTSKSEMLPEVIVETRTEMVKTPKTGRWGAAKFVKRGEGEDVWVAISEEQRQNGMDGRWVPTQFEVEPPTDGKRPYTSTYVWIPEEWKEKVKNITSRDLCPNCRADRQSGWNGKFCRAEGDDGAICGYSHYLHRVKPMGSLLSVAFRRGVIVVDEGTMIQGDYSMRSMVVRGLRSRHKLLLTGTPVKNYIPQAFWLLWWCLGNASKRFPYDYGGKSSFENNHAVIEWAIIGGKKATRKVLPEVTNLSQLWRLLASSIIRRRKEETGEKLVRKTIHPITVPLGEAQHEQMEKWRKDFALFFEEKYPDAPVVQAGAHHMMAPMLGMGMKLDYAATIPQGDPDYEWTEVEGVSNFTPANLRVLEITMALVKEGRKVLVGSQWIPTAKWLADQLEQKGVNSAHLLDESGSTAPPAKRAKMVKAFQDGPVQALCVGIQAVRLGHNLDAASAVVVTGLPWDFESFDQFIARAHRLTSKRPVDTYVVIPGSNPDKDKGTITRRKWDILRQKGDAASLALDGRLIEQDENPVSEAEVVKQMVEQGIPLVGDELPEEDIERLWGEVSHIDHFTPRDDLLQATEEIIVDEGDSQVTFQQDHSFALTITYQAAAALGKLGPRYIAPKPTWEGQTIVLPLPQAEEQEAVELAVPAVYVPNSDVPLPDPDYIETAVSSNGHVPQDAEQPETGNKEEAEVTNSSDLSPNPVSADPSAVVAALKDLAELHKLGVLTDDEFAAGKGDLLAQLKPVPVIEKPVQLSLIGEEV